MWVSTFFRAFCYSGFVSSNIRSLEELSDSRSPVEFEIWSMMVPDDREIVKLLVAIPQFYFLCQSAHKYIYIYIYLFIYFYFYLYLYLFDLKILVKKHVCKGYMNVPEKERLI